MSEASSIPGWVTGGFLAAGVTALAMGIFFRAGRLRGAARYYGDPLFPYYARNVAFSQIPGGVFFLLWFAAALLRGRAEKLSLAFFLTSLLIAPLGVLLTYKPPEWLKPSWLREAERVRLGEHR